MFVAVPPQCIPILLEQLPSFGAASAPAWRRKPKKFAVRRLVDHHFLMVLIKRPSRALARRPMT